MTWMWECNRQEAFRLLACRMQYVFLRTWQGPQGWQFSGMCLEVGLEGRRRQRALVQSEMESWFSGLFAGGEPVFTATYLCVASKDSLSPGALAGRVLCSLLVWNPPRIRNKEEQTSPHSVPFGNLAQGLCSQYGSWQPSEGFSGPCRIPGTLQGMSGSNRSLYNTSSVLLRRPCTHPFFNYL